MLTQFSRSELLLGANSTALLSTKSVCVFGIGGVGGYSVEALARAGVGTIGVVDDDKICLTNINRQLHATHSTKGKYKTDIAEQRILDINPKAVVKKYNLFYGKDTSNQIDLSEFDYIIDAIDTVACKLELISQAKEKNIPIISCMGAGNKLDASAFKVADIFATTICPLAKVMRHELRAKGITNLKVVYSTEPPITPESDCHNSCKNNCVCPAGTVRKCTVRRQIPGSVSFVPSVAGLVLAGECVKELLGLSV